MPNENEGTEQQAPQPDEAPALKYTDADMQRAVQTRVAKEAKKFNAAQEQIAALQAQIEELSPLAERLSEMEEAAEMAGKSAAEKERARAEKEHRKLLAQLEDSKRAIAEREQLAAERLATIHRDREGLAVRDVLAAEKAINAGKAARYALTEIQIEHGDDGMTATYGDLDGVTVAEAVKAWLKDNDNFLPAPAGGAGTRPGSALGGKSSQNASSRDLIAAGLSGRFNR